MTPLHKAPCVPLAGGGPGPLAAHATSDTARWPGLAKSGMSRCRWGTAGGDAKVALSLSLLYFYFAFHELHSLVNITFKGLYLRVSGTLPNMHLRTRMNT